MESRVPTWFGIQCVVGSHIKKPWEKSTVHSQKDESRKSKQHLNQNDNTDPTGRASGLRQVVLGEQDSHVPQNRPRPAPHAIHKDRTWFRHRSDERILKLGSSDNCASL